MTLLDRELEGHGRMGFNVGIGVAPHPAAGEGPCALCACNSVTGFFYAHPKPCVPITSHTDNSNVPPCSIPRAAVQGSRRGNTTERRTGEFQARLSQVDNKTRDYRGGIGFPNAARHLWGPFQTRPGRST